MKKEIAKKWVAALRSGKYRQGRAALHDAEGLFCCLGVLCDLYAKQKGISEPWVLASYGNVQTKVFKSEPAIAYLPSIVQEWAGVKNRYGMIGKSSSLSAMNDTGDSFEQIADFIEACVDQL